MEGTGIKLLSLFNRYFNGRLKWIEMQLLMLLDGQMNVNELCRKANVRASDGTRYTDNLEKMGYIRKELSPTDRRCFVVTITDKGNLAIADFQAEIDGLFACKCSSTENVIE